MSDRVETLKHFVRGLIEDEAPREEDCWEEEEGPQVEIAHLTPADAKRLLSVDIEGERASDPSYVEMYERLMRDGRFELSWDAVVISTKGERLNGKHRLTALSRMPDSFAAPFVLLTNVPTEMHKHGDMGRKRTDAQIAARLYPKGRYHAEREALLSKLYDLVVSPSAKVQYEEKHAALDSKYTRDVERLLKCPASERGNVTGFSAATRAAIVYALGFRQYRAAVEEFLDQFRYGSRGRSHAKQLCEHLKSAHRKVPYSRTELAHMTLYAIQQHILKSKKALALGRRLNTDGSRTVRADLYDSAIEFFRSAGTRR